MDSYRLVAALILSAAAVVPEVELHAQTVTLSDATVTNTIEIDDQDSSDSGILSESYSILEPYNLGAGIGSFGFSAETLPNLEVKSRSSLELDQSLLSQPQNEAFYGGSLGTDTSATYQLVVLGPPSPTPIPVDFVVGLNAMSGGTAYAEASFATIVGGSASNLSVYSNGPVSSIFETIAVSESIGVPDTVSVSANTRSEIDFTLNPPFYLGEGGDARASADPYAFIDPSIADASLYSIEVSPGIGNSPNVIAAVPEPSTYLEMLIGLAVMGVSLRHRRVRFFFSGGGSLNLVARLCETLPIST